ncbi:MAG TPA: hypothetical protein VEZ14_10905, partial [Dehalococcoidia bacterium]|nr:hypothetical protein [Dehalococcoidia bacterium]
GYHIPRPATDYPVAFSHADTYLQFRPGAPMPISKTQYTFLPLAPTSIGVAVGPGVYWDGDATWTGAEATTIGGKSGYLIQSDSGRSFAYETARAPLGQIIWCVIQAPSAITMDDFEKFVSTLR